MQVNKPNKPVDISKLTKNELNDFINQFDVIFSDCDGKIKILKNFL